MKSRQLCKHSFAFVLLSILVGASAAQAQSTSFTYQGRLTDGGTPANGNYDLQFALWDSLSGGAQVGSTQTLNTVAVSNGVFTVTLDFGANAFPGANRFLEISARPSGGGSFTLLSPRQPITPTPYAIRSLNASSADSVSASGVPAGSGNYIQNTASPQASSNFNISGNGTAGGMLSGNVVNATTQFNLNGSRILSTPGTENLFVGFSAGSANTTGFNNAFFGRRAGASNTTGGFNSFLGDNAGNTNTTGTDNSFVGDSAGRANTIGVGNSFFGSSAGQSNMTGGNNTAIGLRANVGFASLTNATAIGANARVDVSNALVLGSINGVNLATADTNVGIGTTTPTAKLSVIATGDGARILHLGTERAWVFKQFGTGAATALELTGDNPNNPKDFVITGNNVGIGTQGPLDRLHVIGDIRVGVFGTNGCLKNNNGGTIIGTCSSDLRFKRDIRPFPNLLNHLVQLRPVHYFWRATEFPEKGFGNAQSYGLVAQEVERALPELVSEDAEGLKQVDYSKLPLMLLQAVKEQQAQIQQQRDLIEQQQAVTRRQQQQLNALKKLACRSQRRARVCR